MKYINAAEVLPEQLLKEIQNYVKGELLYIPQDQKNRRWGEKSGASHYYRNRNQEIRTRYGQGATISQLGDEYGLATDTIRKIIYA